MYFQRTGPSPIDLLLNRVEASTPDAKEVNVRDFLNENEIVNECRAENRRLLEYLASGNRLRELMDIVIMRDSSASTVTPVTTDEDKMLGKTTDPLERYRLPSIACEILASEVNWLSEQMITTDAVLPVVFDYLDMVDSGHLDMNVGTLIARILLALLRTTHDQFLSFIVQFQSAMKPIQLLLKHIDCSAFVDVIVGMIDIAESGRSTKGALDVRVSREGVEILTACEVFDMLANKFLAYLSCRAAADEVEIENDIRTSEDGMANIVQLMKGITHKVLRMPQLSMVVPPLLNLYSIPLVVGTMLDASLEHAEKASGSLCACLDLVIDLLTTECNSMLTAPDTNTACYTSLLLGMSPKSRRHLMGMSPPSGTDPSQASAGRSLIMGTHRLEATLRPRLGKLVAILRGEPAPGEKHNVLGDLGERLGSTRLRLAEFFLACIRHGGDETSLALVELRVPHTLWNLCIAHGLCSMLHCSVSASVVDCFKAGSCECKRVWLEGGIVPNLILAWEEYRSSERGLTGLRGHVVRMLEAVVGHMDSVAGKLEGVSPDDLEKLRNIASGELQAAMESESMTLGGEIPHSSVKTISDDEDLADVLDMEELMEGLARNETDAINRFSRYLFVAESVPDLEASNETREAYQGFVPLTDLDGPVADGVGDVGVEQPSIPIEEPSVPQHSNTQPDPDDEQLTVGNYMEPSSVDPSLPELPTPSPEAPSREEPTAPEPHEL